MCMCVKVDSNVCTYVAMFCACMYTQETEGRQTRLLAVAKAVGSHSMSHYILCCAVLCLMMQHVSAHACI